MLTKEIANDIYTILVRLGGAVEDQRDNFIYHHIKNNMCEEWRFSGYLGFGGKYLSELNQVTCYKEDETSEIKKLILKINSELKKIKIL